MTIQHSQNPDPDPAHRPTWGSSAPLSLDQAGDALALVRHSFGQLPTDSLVLIGLYGGTTGGHLRMDLAPGLQQPRRCAQKAAQWLVGPQADPVPEAVLAAVFTDAAPQPHHHQGATLMRELADALQLQHQCPLLKTWYVGAGFVRDFDCTDPTCCPYPGLLVDDEVAACLARSPQLDSMSRPTAPEQAIETFLAVPLAPSAPSPKKIAALRDAERQSNEPHHGGEEDLKLWEQAITEITATGRCESVQRPKQAAQLLRSAEDSMLVQSLAPLAADSLATARLASPSSTCGEPPAGQYVTVLTGQTDWAPDWARLEALDALLHLLAPYPGTQRRNLLALKGWIEWAKGRGSSAAMAVGRCLEEDPCHPLAAILSELFEASGPCPWARVKQRSYGWWQNRQPV